MDAHHPVEAYEWVVGVGGIMAFMTAFGIGANDVANAFASSVGSRALTVKQAAAIAAVLEFCGALFLGSHVTKTIRKGIADVECFQEDPGLLMYGMMSVLTAVGMWLLLASYVGAPVSTTHSTVGGIVGMTMVARGSSCVVWEEETDEFPYVSGVSAIVISWLLSPIFSGLLAAILYFLVKYVALRGNNPFMTSIYSYPLFLFAALVVNCFFIIYKGASGLDLDETSLETAYIYSFSIGGGLTILFSIFVLPRMKRHIESIDFEQREKDLKEEVEQQKKNRLEAIRIQYDEKVEKARSYLEDEEKRLNGEKVEEIEPPTFQEKVMQLFTYAKKQVLYASSQDLHEMSKDEDDVVDFIHDNAQEHDPRSEEVYKYLQIFTACCDSLAHGGNDVANAMGPFAAIYSIWLNRREPKNEAIESEAELDDEAFWILALGGIGISLGLLIYGYHVMKAIGIKLTKITPSRGFCIELGAAVVILIGTRLEMPLSTTHCQVGATVGVGAFEGFKGVNWKLLGFTVFGWLITLLVAGFFTAVLFAQAVYAPSV